MASRNTQARSRGFTLVEILVALAILALTFGMSYQVLSTGLAWSDRSGAAQAATMVAGALLERVGHDIALADGTVEGRTADGFGWRIAVTPYAAGSAPPAGLAAHQVEVVVSWQERRQLRQTRLVTLRLAAAVPPS
jgi:general secretion pathway protein I